MTVDETGVDKTVVDETVVDKTGVDELGMNHVGVVTEVSTLLIITQVSSGLENCICQGCKYKYLHVR